MKLISRLSNYSRLGIVTIFITLLLAGCGGGGSTPSAPNPMMFNLDFRGSFTGLPDTYAAASVQTGTWVDVPLGTTNALVNTLGTATSVSIVLSGRGDTFSPQTTIDSILLRDSVINDLIFNIPFSVALTGLQDGQYTVYYYSNSGGISGMTINGTATNNLAGVSGADSLGVQGTNWDIATGVTVTSGTLTITDTSLDNDGLSGIQLSRMP